MNKKRNRLYSLLLALVMVFASVFTLALSACAPTDEDNSSGSQSSELTVTSLVLDTSGAKTTFAWGEAFTYEGLKVSAKMSDGTTQAVNLSDCKVSTPSMTSPGQRRVTVSYGGKSAQYTITINERVLPEISETSLLDIEGENATNPYRVEAEDFDMTTPKATLANGYKSFVAEAPKAEEGEEAAVISGNKYLTGYGVKGNYIGFTFTADKAYTGVTMVLRVANPADALISLADGMAVHLNYASDEETHGQISMDGRSVESGGAWTDIVIRDVSIPAGTNELTFDILGTSVPDIDYIDFYVGSRYISSVVELTGVTEENAPVIKDMENFDTEKAKARDDIAAAHGLKDGELFIETINDPVQAANTSGGKSVGAIAKGSQLSTTLRLAEDATVEISVNCASVNDYFVKDNWRFSIDGYELRGVESKNIKDGDAGAQEYYLWKTTSLGVYNLSAGDHLFLVEVVGVDCNVDCFNFNVISYGEYDQSGVDVDKQPIDPEGTLAKDDLLRLEAESLRYQDGLTLREDASSFTESWNNDMGSGVCLKGFTADSEIKAVVEVEEATTVSISFMMSFYDSETFDFSKSVITFAGQTLTATPEGDFGHRDSGDYWKWNKVNLSPVEVEAGVYTLSIVFNEKGMNLDYFEFKSGKGIVEPPAPTYDATLSVGGSARVEAENTDQSGWIARGDWLPGASFTEAWSNDMGSGTSLKGLNKGSVITFSVELEERATVSLKASMAYYDTATYDFAANTSILFAEETLTATAKGEFGHRTDLDYWKWVEVDLGSVTLDAGTYTFTMEFINMGLNIDYFDLTAAAVAEA